MEAVSVCSVTRTRRSNTYSSNIVLPDLYGQLSKYLPTCILRLVLPIFLGIGFMVLISGWERLLGWERWPLYGRYGYVGMTKFLMIKIVLSCRLSTDVPVFSIYGHLFSGWRIATCLRRYVHGWRLRRGILFPYMGDRIIYGSVLRLHLRRSTIVHAWYIFRLFQLLIPETFGWLCTS
jgi:hypothetical protein